MEEKNIYQILKNALDGVNAHVKPENILEDLTVDIAGGIIKNSPYTIWQILKHINYWQERYISYIKDESTPPTLKASIGWDFPSSPADNDELQKEISYFKKSIEIMKKLSNDELVNKAQKYNSGFDVMQSMASHLSYHFGEIVLLRRMLGSWPPPSGGDTW